MRCIDADKLYPDCLTKNGRLAISQSQIANAPTVVNEYTKGFADGERSGRHFPLTDEEKAILVRQWRTKGEWINHRTIMHDGEYYCSNCDEVAEWLDGGSQFLSKFCPNCGAKMSKQDESI